MPSIKNARRTTPKPAPKVGGLVSFDDNEQDCSFSKSFSAFDLSAPQLARIQQAIERVVDTHFGGTRARHKRAKLKPDRLEQLKLDLEAAAGSAASLAVQGPLENRKRGRGRPPDNIPFILIDDIAQACRGAGIKPGLRFVQSDEGFAVDLFIAVAPILGLGNPKNPRKLFERWKRLSPDLSRKAVP